MIARDEEDFIGGALGSVQDLADEMIVVDTGSRDGTILEAKKHGADVYEARWNNDFSEARNFAIERCTKEWILVLDADEEIARADHESIRALVRDEGNAAFAFEQRTYTRESSVPGLEEVSAADEMAKECLAYFADRQIRLFRNTSAIRYACEIHESVEESLITADIPIRESGIILHHYGRITPSNRVYRKTLAWCDKERAGMDACPGGSAYLYEMAAQLLELGRPDDALSHAAVALELGAAHWEFLNIAGLAHMRKGDRDEALSAFRSALRMAAEPHAQLFNNMGVVLMETGESAEALLHFERGIVLEGDNPDILRNAASACALVGELRKGLEYIERSLAIDPFAAHSYAIHADLSYRMNDFDRTARILDSMRFLSDVPFKVYLKMIQLHTRMHRG
ncbi:MAG: glycosyltransferase, partial [Candidatus Krumholzibacteria bacterium]|nr:glycosyltransferase [Candidatus Krumholzibacteria bacterium]